MSLPEISRRCLSCGAAARAGSRFCQQCGKPLEASGTGAPETRGAEASRASVPPAGDGAPPAQNAPAATKDAPAATEAPPTKEWTPPTKEWTPPTREFTLFEQSLGGGEPRADGGAAARPAGAVAESQAAAEPERHAAAEAEGHAAVEKETPVVYASRPGVEAGRAGDGASAAEGAGDLRGRVARVREGTRARVERMRDEAIVVLEEAPDDSGLRFVVAAVALFVVFIIILFLTTTVLR